MLSRRQLIGGSTATLFSASVRSAPLSFVLTGDAVTQRSDWNRSSIFAWLGQMLRDMRAKAAPITSQPNLFADVFTDESGIDARASKNFDYDVRKVVGPQRASKSTVASEESFDSIANWPTRAGASVVNPRDPDPTIGRVVELDTGSTAGRTAKVKRYFGQIPATFGVSVLMGMVTANKSAAEALEFQVQNRESHLFRLRVFSGAVQFFYDGAWRTQFPYGGSTSTLTEWWFNASYNGNANYTVRLFAGTQELPSFTGHLPTGTPGKNGWVGFIQHSSSLARRKGRIALLQIGSNALPADMSLVSVAQDVATEPNAISMAVLFEDVSAQTVLNVDLKAWASKDGGSHWKQVPLTRHGRFAGGVLDSTKPIYLAAGQIDLPATGGKSVRCRMTSANGRYFSLDGYAWRVDA